MFCPLISHDLIQKARSGTRRRWRELGEKPRGAPSLVREPVLIKELLTLKESVGIPIYFSFFSPFTQAQIIF